jgi:shikimate dehydrogenase
MRTTTLCGSLSLHPVSLGAAMHRAGYAACGLDFAYVPFRVAEDGLAAAVAAMRALDIRGLGVSMPFKQQVLPLLDELGDEARRIGAVNTLVQRDGRVVGHNTDAVGARRALEELVELRGRRALVLGAGGAARAVAHGLCGAGAVVDLWNRSADKAAQLAAELRTHYGPGAATRVDVPELGAHELLVNASSAGMYEYGAASPTSFADASPALVVMDIVYKPVRTELLREAEARGLRVLHGGRMLLHQAAAQFALYTGREAPLDAMDAALQAQLAPDSAGP